MSVEPDCYFVGVPMRQTGAWPNGGVEHAASGPRRCCSALSYGQSSEGWGRLFVVTTEAVGRAGTTTVSLSTNCGTGPKITSAGADGWRLPSAAQLIVGTDVDAEN